MDFSWIGHSALASSGEPNEEGISPTSPKFFLPVFVPPFPFPLTEKDMTQRHLDRLVARATGETLATIRRLGFGLAPGATRPRSSYAGPKPRPGREGRRGRTT